MPIIDFDSSWIKGSNSQLDPSATPQGYAWSFINMLNVSGVPSCRPGHRCIAKLPEGKIQGCAFFRPTDGLEQIMVAVGGVIYVSTYPFTEYRFLPNVLFSPTAKRVFFQQTTQSNERITPDTLESAIEVITPKQVMIMQDGANTAPAFYDGASSGHIRDHAFETPAGGLMAWIGDRLWIANDNNLKASDIGNPFSFREGQYLGGLDALYFNRDITGLISTPSLEFPQLFVTTDQNTSLVQAAIRDRASWATTDGFQREILQVGCLADRAIVSHFGRLIWWSQSGVVFYDPATSRGWTSRTPVRDNEMMVSKAHISDDVTNAAMGIFGQWLLISLPVEDQYNKQTWVLNGASYESINDEGGPTWSGYWIGTRPVQWLYGNVAGVERIYHISFDEDEQNRLWESFTPDRLDNGCPITWGIITRGMFGLSSQTQKIPGSPIRFNFSEIALMAIDEDVDVGVFVAPGVRGSFRQIASKTIRASKGSIDYRIPITADSELFAMKAQYRKFRTQDLQTLPNIDADAACNAESDQGDGIDESFQILIVGQGPATLRWIRSWANDQSDDSKDADAKACDAEDNYNGVRFDGIGFHDESLDALIADLTVTFTPTYDSSKTVSLTSGPYTAVGTGTATSIISQRAADRVANIVANQQAEAELAAMIPPIYSEGLEDVPEPTPPDFPPGPFPGDCGFQSQIKIVGYSPSMFGEWPLVSFQTGSLVGIGLLNYVDTGNPTTSYWRINTNPISQAQGYAETSLGVKTSYVPQAKTQGGQPTGLTGKYYPITGCDQVATANPPTFNPSTQLYHVDQPEPFSAALVSDWDGLMLLKDAANLNACVSFDNPCSAAIGGLPGVRVMVERINFEFYLRVYGYGKPVNGPPVPTLLWTGKMTAPNNPNDGDSPLGEYTSQHMGVAFKDIFKLTLDSTENIVSTPSYAADATSDPGTNDPFDGTHFHALGTFTSTENCLVWFQWGVDSFQFDVTNTTDPVAYAGSASPQSVDVDITGTDSLTTYMYRLVVQTSSGSLSYGQWQRVTTGL